MHKFYKTIVLLILSNIILSGQSINFKHFGLEHGLIHPSIYTINQDKSGFLWIGTGSGICRFDGIKFIKPNQDSLTDAYSSTSYKAKNGKLWIGYDDGSVFVVENLKLKKIYQNPNNPSIITSITEDEKGNIFIASQSAGILLYANNQIKNIKLNENKLVYALQIIDNNRLILGTNEGLWIARKNNTYSYTYHQKIKEIPNEKINCIIPCKNEKAYWIGTSENGFYKYKVFPKEEILHVSEKFKILSTNVQWILEDKSSNLWICTFGNGVYKFTYDTLKKTYTQIENYNENFGLGDSYVKYAFQDNEGNIWFGTYSNGITGILDEAFVFYRFKQHGMQNDILSITSTFDGVWLGSRNALYFLSNNNTNINIYGSNNGIPTDAITSLAADRENIWIGTEKSGVFQFRLSTKTIQRFFYSENTLENRINKIISLNNNLWIATNGGLFLIDSKTKKKHKYSTDTDLPHNKINDVFVDSKNNVWVATKGLGLYSVLSNKHIKIDTGSEIEFIGITEDKFGNLWAITYGDGIFGFLKDSIIHLSERNGLKSNYAYSIISDKEGNLWVGHRLAISKINPKSFNIISYSTEIGILGDCNLHAITLDSLGNIRFGSTDGLIQYNALLNKKEEKKAPAINITSIRISDKEFDINEPIVLPYGKYRIRIEYIGIYFRSPKSVKYQYQLEGWETVWSDITENTYAYYPRLEDGNYTFKVRAISSEGLVSEDYAQINIIIQPPLWKRWWFITLITILVIVSIYFYIKFREKKQIEFQRYLQELLNQRTKEVIQQKEEIEIKNRDITDSITYAQRIQNSILPSIKKLQELFSGCFIFYQPRDIVSGDFYWFDKISDTKFVIVCGDSTGHGVPGALMSMIGTTLVKDICNRPDVTQPSDILVKLDEEMRAALNQNFDQAESSDGMDLIACEIDVQSYKVTIASAMRPVILYINGKQVYVSGSKSSIGGIMYNNEIKSFENQTYQLNRGDLIYMFSDGYPDQFGGPLGKKFKMVRLKNLLNDICELPMEEQYYQIKNNFNLWKGQFEQIDDVLFMGIKL